MHDFVIGRLGERMVGGVLPWQYALYSSMESLRRATSAVGSGGRPAIGMVRVAACCVRQDVIRIRSTEHSVPLQVASARCSFCQVTGLANCCEA